MLRIFRGERHGQGAAQPGQQEQNAGTASGQQSPAAEMTTTPQITGPQTTPPQSPDGSGSNVGTQSLGAPAPPLSASQTAAGSQSLTGGAESALPGSESSPQQAPPEREPGFLDRGRIRRRARFLRVARELAYRDLGGLVFDLHRFAKRNDEIVGAKLDTLSRIDSELRALEETLRERKPVAVLREAGVAACPRCAAIHGSGDRFCPTCGLSVDQTERPIATPNAAAAAPPGAGWPPPAPEPLQPWQATPPTRPPAVQPAAIGRPPIPQPSPAPDEAIPAPADPAAPPRPAATPVPARTRPRAADPPTEVIRSGLQRAPAPGQQTVSFDPIASPQGRADRAEDESGRESRQDRP